MASPGILLATGVLGSWIAGALLLGWLAAAVAWTARWHLRSGLGGEPRGPATEALARRRALLLALSLAAMAWACLAGASHLPRDAAPLDGVALCGTGLLLGFLSLARLRVLHGGVARHLLFAVSLCASLLAAQGAVMFAARIAAEG